LCAIPAKPFNDRIVRLQQNSRPVFNPMIHHARSKFKNTSYQPSPYGASQGPALGRVAIRREFDGEMQGFSLAELLTCQPAAVVGYVGSDQFEGKLAGRSGSFVFQHTGILEGGKLTPAGYIVPGSGTGELAGIRGSALISVTADGQHTLDLDYTFDDPAPKADGA
jgi:hypothetical protein